jgi:hypothetical protein
MDIRKDLDRKIDNKKTEIAGLERELCEAQAYLQALLDMRKLLPRDEENQEEIVLRPNSDLAKVRDILEKEGKALHVDELLKRLGKGTDKKVSLSGSLSGYARDNKIFVRTAPNTFGLIGVRVSSQEESGPPDDFGLNGAKES